MSARNPGGLKRPSDSDSVGTPSKEKCIETNASKVFSVVIKGVKRALRDENPLVIEPSLRRVIGGTYSDIKVLPSGDISVKCASQEQANKLLLCKYLGNSEKPIEIRAELYQSKGTEARGVISDVPLDLTDGDILKALSDQHVIYAKRMPYRSDKSLRPSRSVLICFSTGILPTVVQIGFIRFRTRVYNPPPLRCFNCNRYGHKGKNCRSVRRCTRCGERHDYAECKQTPRCINCGGAHSAGYAGCKRYRLEARINAVMANQKVNYWTARRAVEESIPDIRSTDDFPPLRSQQNTNSTIENSQQTHTAAPSNEPLHADRPANSTDPNSICFTSTAFFEFITQVIKNTLICFSEGKNLSVASIVSKSANEKLGIQLPLYEDSPEPDFTCQTDTPMDLSKTTDTRTTHRHRNEPNRTVMEVPNGQCHPPQ